MSFAVKVGAVGGWIDVQEALRDRHARVRKSVDEVIARRTKIGAPLDEAPDWRAAAAAVLDPILDSKRPVDGVWRFVVTGERDAALDAIDRARAVVAGGRAPLGDYEPDDRLDGLSVRVRAVSKADVLQLDADLAAVDAMPDGIDRERHRMLTWLGFLEISLVGVRGPFDDGDIEADDLAPDDDDTARAMSLIDRAGFTLAIFAVARDYQGLSPLQRRGFGSPRPSTSPGTSAASAPSDGGQPSDVAAVQQAAFSPPRNSKPIDVRSGTSSTATLSGSASSPNPASSEVEAKSAPPSESTGPDVKATGPWTSPP